MPSLEIKRKSELSRKAVGEQLVALGRALANGSEVDLGSAGTSIKIVVAEQVQFEFEVEIEGDEVEIELEIKWRDGSSDEPADASSPAPGDAAPVKAVRRGRPRATAAK